MKKILMLGCQDNSFYNFRKEMVLAFKEHGYSVILASPYGSKIDYFTDRGIRFVDVNMQRRGTNPFSDLNIIKQYLSIIKEYDVDIILTFSSKCAIYGGWAAKRMKKPCIVNNSGLIILPDNKKFLQPFINMMYRFGDSHVSCMMYQNSYERDVLNKVMNNKVSYKLIPGSGVNLEEFMFEEYPEQSEKLIFNYVARIMKGKGINEYLACAKVIKREFPNTEFRIFGSYDDEYYKDLVEEYERNGCVKYCGVQMNMKPFIKEAHAVIHPSYSEGMTNVCLEHSSMGRVCIGSNIPGVKEIIDDGKTGFLFEVKNVNSLVEAVKKFILLSHEKKVEMGRNARIKMEKEFSREIVTNTYIEEISRILKQHPKMVEE